MCVEARRCSLFAICMDSDNTPTSLYIYKGEGGFFTNDKVVKDIDKANVEPEARAMLADFDDFARHYEVAFKTP